MDVMGRSGKAKRTEQVDENSKKWSRVSTTAAYLQIIHLEPAHGYQNDRLGNAPPFHSIVCRFRRVPVHTFANNNVLLFVFDCLETNRQFADFTLNRRDRAYPCESDPAM